MNVLVLGAGQVGFGIARYFKAHGTDVTVIEKSHDIVQEIRSGYGINAIVGNAINIEVLKNANAENSTHVIATMSSDEQNIIACKLVDSIFNIQTKIARIRSHTFLQGNIFELFLKKNFGIDAIAQPELDVSNEMYKISQIRGAFDVIQLKNSVIIGTKCLPDTEILNTTFKHFQGITDINLFVLTVTRNGRAFFPTSKDVLLPGDEVYFATIQEHLDEAMRLFGYKQKTKKNILIIGGGNVGFSLLKTISEKKSEISATILDKSVDRAEEVAQKFPKFITVLGDSLNHDLLQEITPGVDIAFVCTNDDKVNVLSSLLLKQFNIEKILAITNNRNLESLLDSGSGKIAINPSLITIRSIIEKSRKSKYISVTQIKNKSLYVVEAQVLESCKNVGAKIASIVEKDQIIPIFLLRDGEIFIAKKDIALLSGDIVILAVAKSSLKSVEKIFSGYSFVKESDSNNIDPDIDEIDRLIEEDNVS